MEIVCYLWKNLDGKNKVLLLPDVESEPNVFQESTEIKSGDIDMKPACEPKKIVSESQPNKIPVKDVMADNSDHHQQSGRFTIFSEMIMYIHVHIHAYHCIEFN